MSEQSPQFTQDGTDVLVAATLLALGGYALGNVVAALVATFVEAGGVEVSGDPVVRTLVGTIAVQGITFVGGTLAFLHVADRWDLLRAHLPSRRDLGLVVLGVGLLVGSFFAFDVIYNALGISTAESSIVAAGRSNPTLLLYLIPLSVLVVAPGEELLYRGLVQGWLRQSFGPAVAVALTSVLFASIHVWGYAGTPLPSLVATLAIITFLAVYLGALYEYSENLLVPILVHGCYNALQFVLAYWQVTGGF